MSERESQEGRKPGRDCVRVVALDTSTDLASFGLYDGEVVVSEHELQARHAHGELLLPAIDLALKAAGWKPSDVGRWIVGVGPGSFTGTRIGVSLVKGIALATGVDVVAVTSLEAIAYGVDGKGGRVVALLPAGKNELFVQIDGGEITHAQESVVESQLLATDVVVRESPRASKLFAIGKTREPSDLGTLEPLYVRAPDITKPAVK